MGCGGASLSKQSAENTELSDRLSTFSKEKEWYDKDKLGFTLEMEKLRKEKEAITTENEGLKDILKRYQTSSQVAGDPGPDPSLLELISLDQSSGDYLLALLERAQPKLSPQVQATLAASEQLQQSPPSLLAYKSFLGTRSEVLRNGWTAYTDSQEKTVKLVKEALAAFCDEVESIVGKEAGLRGAAEKVNKSDGVEAVSEFVALTRAANHSIKEKVAKTKNEYEEHRDRLKDELEAKIKKKKQKIHKLKEAMKNGSSSQGKDFVEFEDKFARLKEQNDKLSAEITQLCGSTEQLKSQQNTKMRKVKRLKEQWKAEMVALVGEVKTYVSDTKQVIVATCEKLQESNAHWQANVDVLQAKIASLTSANASLLHDINSVKSSGSQQSSEYHELVESLESKHQAQVATLVAQFEGEKAALTHELSSYKQQMADSVSSSDHQSAFYKSRCDALDQELAKSTQLSKLEIERLNDQLQQYEATLKGMVSIAEVDAALRRYGGELRTVYAGHNEELARIYSESGVELWTAAGDLESGSSLQDFEAILQRFLQESRNFSAKDREILSKSVSEFSRVSSELTETVGARDSLLRTIQAKEDEISGLQTLKARLTQQVEDLSESMTEGSRDSQALLDSLRTEIEGLKKDVAGKDLSIDGLRGDIGDLTKEVETNAEELDSYRGEIEGLKEELAAKEKSIETHRSEIDTLKLEVAKKNESIEVSQNEVQALKRDLAAKSEAIESTLSEVNTLKQDISAKTDFITALQSEIDALKQENASKSDTIEFSLSEVKTLKQNISGKTDLITALQSEIDALKQEKASMAEKVQSSRTEIEELKGKIQAFQRDILNKISEMDTLTTELADANKLISDFKVTLAETEARYKAEVERLQNELSSAAASAADIQSAFDFLKSTHSSEVDRINSNLAQATASLSALQASSEDSAAKQQSEIDRLANELQDSAAKLEAEKSSFAGTLQSVTDSSAAEKEALRGEMQLISEAKSQLEVTVRGLEAQVAELSERCGSLESELQSRALAETAPEPFSDDESLQPTEEQRAVVSFAQQVIESEFESTLLSTGLVESIKKAKGEKPLPKEQTFAMLEEMIARKAEMDQLELSNHRAPQPFGQFIVEFMTKKFGMKKLAQKNFCQMAATLDELYTGHHPYGTIFCRLLQIIHPEPFSNKLGFFLTSHWVDFAPLCEKYRSEKHGGRSSPKSDNVSTSGGHAWLTDVIGLIYQTFANDRSSGKRMLMAMRPAKVGETDYIAFLIAERLIALGNTLEAIFSESDKVTWDEFTSTLSQALSLWISKKSLRLLFRETSGGVKSVSKAALCARISPQWAVQVSHTKDYLTSKAAFVLAIVSVYKTQLIREGVNIKRKINEEPLSWGGFTELMHQVDSTIGPEPLGKLWELSGGNSDKEDGLQSEKVVKTLLATHMGRISRTAFSKDYADMGQTGLLLQEEAKTDITSPRGEVGKPERGGRGKRGRK